MKILIYGINTILLFSIARYEYNSNSDKTIIISSIAFGILLTLNLLFGLFEKKKKKAIARHFYYSALGLFIGALTLLYIW